MAESFQYYTFDFKEVAPSLDDLLRFMKSETIGESNPVKEIAAEFLGLLQSYDTIEGGYVVKPVVLTEQKGLLRIEDMILKTGRQIAGYLKGTETVAVFVCTAGQIFSDLSKTNNENGNYLEAYIVDTIGSLTVENAMDRIQADLRKKSLEDGSKITNRYSPGYCNWPLPEQQKLFHLLGDKPVNVTLSSSCLMQPIKSVSGIIGVGRDVNERAYGCAVCNNKDCIYRKILEKSSKTESRD